MKILHIADIHLGQVIYQNYERADEHAHYFAQLETWCRTYAPDALVVSGDVFDIQQPSATTQKAFTDHFVRLHLARPTMEIIIIAGNHDSASRLQAGGSLWALARARVIGVPPPLQPDDADGWQQYVIACSTGYVVALPYVTADRRATVQALLDHAAALNAAALPVVLAAHLAVRGCDTTGHHTDIGGLRTQSTDSLGTGYDYLALGHIHKPQTLGHPDTDSEADVTLDAPVMRYAGSALHVSCDETYPHTASLVDIDRHGGRVRVRQLRVDELRHFHVLPSPLSAYATADEALDGLRAWAESGGTGYFRFRFEAAAALPAEFNQLVYALLGDNDGTLRYNPQPLRAGTAPDTAARTQRPQFDVADLQAMRDPLQFIEQTQSQYPELDMDDVRRAFADIEAELRAMDEEAADKRPRRTAQTPPTQQ